MAVRPVFRRHDAAGQTRYQELKQLARSQGRVLSGTPLPGRSSTGSSPQGAGEVVPKPSRCSNS